ncbi:MAG: hypothetical protein ACI9G1_004398 [Pirellulaceae bacterium]|jgi:hypothetical protein
MSQQSSAADVVQKQRFSIYTMMLILAFFALVTGCTLLYFELKEYGEYPWWNTNAARTGQVDIIPSHFDHLG